METFHLKKIAQKRKSITHAHMHTNTQAAAAAAYHRSVWHYKCAKSDAHHRRLYNSEAIESKEQQSKINTI